MNFRNIVVAIVLIAQSMSVLTTIEDVEKDRSKASDEFMFLILLVFAFKMFGLI